MKPNLKQQLLLIFLTSISFSSIYGQGALLKEKSSTEEKFLYTKGDHSQTAWYKEMRLAKPNIRKAEKEFISYFGQHPNESSQQRKIFIRWLLSAKLSVDEQGYYLPIHETVGATKNPTVKTTKKFQG